ncbi:hypothetical protein BGZ93_003547, partial [Podila epicladia]
SHNIYSKYNRKHHKNAPDSVKIAHKISLTTTSKFSKSLHTNDVSGILTSTRALQNPLKKALSTSTKTCIARARLHILGQPP